MGVTYTFFHWDEGRKSYQCNRCKIFVKEIETKSGGGITHPWGEFKIKCPKCGRKDDRLWLMA